MTERAGVVICGAGIAGVAAAYHLAVRQGIRRVVLVDEREPLTLTSDKGTQAYRNWWPGPDDTMLQLVSRSIDLLEESAIESGNQIRLNRHGYLFVTADDARAERLKATASQVAAYGMGPIRTYNGASPYSAPLREGFVGQPDGADLLLGDDVCRGFPYLSERAIAALHVRRAGWFNAVALGAWLLKGALAAGARFVRDRVERVDTTGGRVRSVQLASGDSIDAERFVIAAGPATGAVGRLLGLELPVMHELHAKLTFRDTRRVIRRDAPFVIWTDPMTLEWTADERRELERDEHTRKLLDELPGGVHVRPVDLSYGNELYLIWTFETDVRPYVWPPVFNPWYGEVVLRGCAQMIPGMAPYVGSASAGVVDGGYYCKTPENRPLVGPLPVEGAYILGALSGMGVMASHAAAELLSLHIAEKRLPDYARWFLASRYDDPGYRALVEAWGPLVGQL